MSDQDPTRGDDPSRSEVPPTQAPTTDPAPTFDSLQTTPPPPSIPETRFEVADSLLTPPPTTDTYATAHPDSPPTLYRESTPEAFPGYELLETLGEGGMGIVYQARQVGLNRLVALKVVLKGRRAGPKDLIRFLAEAESIASIKHPNVVQVHEYGESDSRPFLAMEYLSGGTLADRLKREGRIAPSEAAVLVAKLARAVQAAHDQGIVHRDLKPANILFDAQDEPKVTDFGLAKRAKGTDLTHTQAVMGTPAYMSPEQARGQTKFVGPPADIYALGVILYECLAGKRPFHDADTHLLLRQVIEDEPTRPTRHVPGIPRDLELIALLCLAKDPEDRYPTAAALAEDLERFTAGEPVSVRAAGTIERALKWARRKPTLAAVYALSAAVSVLIAFGVSLVVLWRNADDARQQAVKAQIGEAKERKNAEKARDGEKDSLEKLARVEYGRAMQAAHQTWRDNNRAESLALLNHSRDDLKGWEWKFVEHLWHSELLNLKGHTDGVTSVAWSPDGSRLATGSEDGTARIWDAQTGTEIRVKGHPKPFGFYMSHSGYITCVTWSPDGSRIASTSSEGMTEVWDALTGAKILGIRENFDNGELDQTLSNAWSPDGSRIATVSLSSSLMVYDARTGDMAIEFKEPPGKGRAVAWSPDGSLIAFVSNNIRPNSNNNFLEIWNINTGLVVNKLKGHSGKTVSLAWSPDGSRIATAGGDNNVRMWDARSGEEENLFKGHTKKVNTVAWSLDGSLLATAGDDNTARVWDPKSGDEVLTAKVHASPVNSVAWSPDGSRIATGSGSSATDIITARVWNARTDPEAVVLKETNTEFRQTVSWSPDGSRIVTASNENTSRVWDLRTSTEVLTLKGHTSPVNSAAWSPDGNHIATASGPRYFFAGSTDDDNTARIWDARTGFEVITLKAHTKRVNCVSWSPDGSHLATASADNTVRVWDARIGNQVMLLKGHSSPVTCVSWSPDGSRIATTSSSKDTVGDENSARIWNAHTGTELYIYRGHQAGLTSLAWSPDGAHIATASEDGMIRVWAPNRGDLFWIPGYGNCVNSLSWSPDGSRLATANDDRTARMFDSSNGAELLTLRGHTDVVTSVAWSPDGSRLATIGHDNTARLWGAQGGTDLRVTGR